MARVEFFELDHTRVRAPYVRVAGRYTSPHGNSITKYDLRLTQPNRLEPYNQITVLDGSPIGFPPGVSELECGDWREDAPEKARRWANTVLERGFIVQESIPIHADI